MVTPGVNGEPKKRMRLSGAALLILWTAIGAGALLLLLKSVQNSAEFGRLQPWILLLNVVGVIALSLLLARKLWQLVREYRDHVPGSRLTARTVMIFGALVIAPLLIVYLSSLEFLNRGIDSWFQVEVKQGLNDALVLSRAALDLRMREYSQRTQSLAGSLAKAAPADIQSRLDDERRVSEGLEIVLFGEHERIIAASLENPLETLPSRPPSDLIRQVGQLRPYVSLEPQSGGKYLIRTAAALSDSSASTDSRYVVAIYPVPAQLSALSEAVQRSYSQYGDLAAMREPLKYSFRLTLTLVLLLAMLAAIYGAIFSAQRLVRPVQDLIAGTRAVGKGDFGTRLPLPSRDEMGFLVHSFNDMTKRLRRAHEEATHSQQAVERERERLAIILARLSTGVVAVDRTLTVRMANHAAGAILGTDLSAATGRSLPELAASNERLGQFVAAIAVRFAGGREEWREQLDLDSHAGRRTLMCACTPLPGEDSDMGYVIVFDDITALLQAQRDAAWGEVARRLAHEIKNPLTPIQLSAERLRRRLLSGMNPRDAEILDRATHTIVQQVETMQQMVNAFSEYARAPEMRITQFSLNQLVTDVADLYRSQDPRAVIHLGLDEHLEGIEADRGRVRQILNNLVTNALEALEGVGTPTLEITTRLESGGDAAYAVVTVCDNGPGFQRELLGRVFDPYVTSKPKGTGLGLAIVKKIVEEHGGRIDADNRPEGGARVRVVLPVKDSTRSATGGARERREQLRRERA
ncbi:MAG: nitrogen metabolism signal transduction histidine kinase NtrY [Gammaproteobacteria bacterium]|jgi:PAS domain S-box-containing protein|nr:nitrogen metabolism signal transduction histidine kinase NtrY [Gammaproteobacteria bacterium]